MGIVSYPVARSQERVRRAMELQAPQRPSYSTQPLVGIVSIFFISEITEIACQKKMFMPLTCQADPAADFVAQANEADDRLR